MQTDNAARAGDGAGDWLDDSQGFFYSFTALAEAAATQARGGRPFVTLSPAPGTDLINPAYLERLCAQLLAQRLLILHGRADTPVSALLRRLAFAVRDAVGAANRGLAAPAALAFIDGARAEADLSRAISGEGAPAVIVVDLASRRLAGWDLERLRASAEQRGHYLLLASPTGAAAWRLSLIELIFWHEVEPRALYAPDTLVQLLRASLAEQHLGLPAPLASQVEQQAASLAARLGNPLKIQTFLHTLAQPGTDAPAIDSLADQIARAAPADTIRRRFRALTRRQQLLAFGLCFFEGLWEETVYHYLGTLMFGIWGQRENGALLDRVDLTPLEDLFVLSEARPQRIHVEPRYPSQRRQIFEEALPTLRQHARHTLYWLARLLSQPGDPASAAASERDELRDVIGRATSDIVPLAPELLEEPLLLLVADARPAVRAQLAAILADWYVAGDDARTRFFANARRWRGDLQPAAFVRNLLDREARGETDARDQIDAVLALASTHAALAERPGDLPADLVQLLRELSASPGPQTCAVLREVTIPQLTTPHLAALSEWLHELTRDDNLRPVVSAQLAAAASADGDLVADTVVRWQQQAASAAPYQEGEPRSVADTALVAVGQVYTLLNRQAGPGSGATLSTVQVLGRVRDLPRHPDVRRSLDGALLQLGVKDPVLWHDLLDRLSSAEIGPFVELLRANHLDERARMGDGEAEMPLGTRSYAVSLSDAPPETSSAQFVTYALDRGGPPAVYLLAMRAALAMVRDFDIHEARFVNTSLDERAGVVAPPPPPAPARAKATTKGKAPTAVEPQPARGPGFFRDHFLPIFVTHPDPSYRPAIEALLPEADELPPTEAVQLEFLLRKRWPASPIPAAQEIAARLWQAVEINRRGASLISPLDYPRACAAMIQALREEGLLTLALVLIALLIVVVVVIVLFLI